ncbi:MAG TPA: hypothetical protein PKA48_18285, partial [Candidatus Obscuribacter sp.]|nr:hypothetical protein [Candidatus Obscuribacter sp.]
MNQRSRFLLILLGALLLLSPASAWAGDYLTGERSPISYCENDGLVSCVVARCRIVEKSQRALFEVERKIASSAVP